MSYGYTQLYVVQQTTEGCESGRTQVTATINPNPTLTIPNPVSFCQGSNFSVTLAGADTYSWTGPGTFSGTTNPITFTNAPTNATGVYTVIGTSTANCTASATTAITVYALPTITALPITVCSGGTINLSVTGADTYTWSGPNSFTATGASPSIVNAVANMVGIYTITGTSNGCIASATTTVAVTQTPTATATATSLTVSTGQSTTLQGGGGTSYAWTGPNGYTSTEQNPVIISFAATKAGVYTLTATQGNCSATATVALALSTCNFTVTPTITVCNGQDVNFSASGGDTYLWSGQRLSSPNVANPTIYYAQKSSDEGTFTVTITKNGANACTATYNVEVIISNPYDFTPRITDRTLANCSSSYTLEAEGCPGNATFKWYDISPENPVANRTIPLTETSNIITKSVTWNFPQFKVECIVPGVTTSCPPANAVKQLIARKQPTITLKSIIQPCENTESIPTDKKGKVKFEVTNATSSTAFVLVNTYVTDPGDWNAAISTFHGSPPTGTGYSNNAFNNIRTVRYVLTGGPDGSNDKNLKTTSSSAGGVDTYIADVPANSSSYKIFLLDNQSTCMAKSENFEVYQGSALTSTVTQDNIVNCNADLGATIVTLQATNDFGTLFAQNKALFTRISPNSVNVLDDQDNVIKNITKTAAVGANTTRDYSFSLAGLPPTVTIEDYQACIVGEPKYNSITCDKLAKYRIAFTAGDGCKYESPRFVIQQPKAIELSAKPTDPTCFGQKIPQVDLISKGGNTGKKFYLVDGTSDTYLGDATTVGTDDKYTALATQYGATLPYKFKSLEKQMVNGYNTFNFIVINDLEK